MGQQLQEVLRRGGQRRHDGQMTGQELPDSPSLLCNKPTLVMTDYIHKERNQSNSFGIRKEAIFFLLLFVLLLLLQEAFCML